MSVRVFAPAKINLTLEVGRSCDDGRHPLRSIVVFADVGDVLEAAPAADVTLAIDGPFAISLPTDETNLAMRAARVLAAAGGVRAGVALKLTKNLPIASGIGGGSSDAAATLKALNALWQLGRDEAELCSFARELGADVPICVYARSALMTGTGEQFSPFPLAPLDAVLINPLLPLSTRDVYRQFDAMGLGRDFDSNPPSSWEQATRGNDLEAAAVALMPELLGIRALLEALPGVGHVGLSGSGATMFALVDTREAALEATLALRQGRPDAWVAPVRLSTLDPAASPV